MNLYDPTAGEAQYLQLFKDSAGLNRYAYSVKTYAAVFGAGVFHFNIGLDALGKVAYITPWMPGASGAYFPPGAIYGY